MNAGKTQQQLATEIGCTSATLISWEAGRVSPRLSDLERIAEALGITVEDLIRKQPEN